MAFKVTKKLTHYAVVKDEHWGDFYIVDIEHGAVLNSYWQAKFAKKYAQMLEDGDLTADKFASKWNTHYMEPIDMPDSLKAQQAKILSGKVPAVGAAKPIGSAAPSITEVIDKGTWKLLKMSDGTYGYFIPSTGEYSLGRKTAPSSSPAKKVKKHAEAILQKQGVDAGANATDTLINLYEMRVRELYGRTAAEMESKLSAYLARYAEQDAAKQAAYEAGEITAKELKAWRSSQAAVIQNQRNLIETLSRDLASADKMAMDMLNGYVHASYAENLSFGIFQIEEQVGVHTSFSMYNADAVQAILKDPDQQLLPPNPNVSADMQWSRQKISSSIGQSVLNGESIPKAAARLQSVVGMSANAAVRAARTAMTGAQNYGRLEAGRRAAAMGIKVKKQWVATHDERTRFSHRELDREVAEEEEEFSNGLMYPADWSGEPAEVYNCRCSMRHVVDGHEYDDLPDYTKEGVAYEEWKHAGQAAEQAKVEKYQQQMDGLEAKKNGILNALPENKTYDGIWKQPVTLDDYEAKKGSIQAKKDYYAEQIAKGSNVAHHEAMLKSVEEFEASGKAYADAKAAVQAQLDAIDAQKGKIADKLKKARGVDVFSDERKAAAFRWSSKRDADDHLRPLTEKAWAEATRKEQLAVWGYTDGSGKYNRPLSGFQGGWGSYNYKGIGNVDFDYEGGGQAIKDMTSFIKRSVTEDDMWVRRGCGYECMDSFFGTSFGAVSRMSNDELQQFVGRSNRIAGFVSCGTASESGAGFSGSVDMKIFVPKGTQATYAEPYSSYTGAGYSGKNWDGKMKQSYIGSEDETIIQRGASYTCTKVERGRYGGLYVEMECHPEQGYDFLGWE